MQMKDLDVTVKFNIKENATSEDLIDIINELEYLVNQQRKCMRQIASCLFWSNESIQKSLSKIEKIPARIG